MTEIFTEDSNTFLDWTEAFSQCIGSQNNTENTYLGFLFRKKSALLIQHVIMWSIVKYWTDPDIWRMFKLLSQ